jgi:hypothetical protein
LGPDSGCAGVWRSVAECGGGASFGACRLILILRILKQDPNHMNQNLSPIRFLREALIAIRSIFRRGRAQWVASVSEQIKGVNLINI